MAPAVAAGLALALALAGVTACAPTAPAGAPDTGAPAAAANTTPPALTGQAAADASLAQWKMDNAGRAVDWVAEEKAHHELKPPFDNSYLLTGGDGQVQTYGAFTEQDVITWARETEALAAEGSRIFHSGELLGTTVSVSCDMCHPDASNTHPETYPKYQTQMGRVALLRDMINWCLINPVRAEPLAPDDARMRALEAYIYAQRSGVPLAYGKQ
jgi:cytochrome c